MPNNSSSIEDLLSDDTQGKLKQDPAKTTDDKTKEEEEKVEESSSIEESATSQLSGKLKQLSNEEEEEKVKEMAKELGLPYIDFTGFPISSEALRSIPLNISEENKIVCFVNTAEQIRLATTNPDNTEIEKIQKSLADAHHAQVELYLISELSMKKAMDNYNKLPKYKKAVAGVSIDEAELEKFKKIGADFKSLDEHVKKIDMTQMVSLIIAASIQAGSSDIHIEAEEKDVKVRLRVDGILHDAASIKKDDWPKVISRIKLLAKLKLNITAKPQDGRFTIVLADGKIDVRVSTLPTAWGESVVMRLLKSSTASLEFEDLGLVGDAYKKLKAQTEKPNGMIITTGPTGSGKTTTLYAILNKLNTEGVKIITLEDPVEYKLEGINQSQIDHSKGYSFADGLKSILRQDPDVVMVGELRDLETSETAINASLTGHLVVSTLHTNSAAGAIPRFLAMGIKPFLLAPSLNAIMAQRLVRKVCEKCKKEVQPEAKDLEKITKILEAIPAEHPDRPDLSKLTFYKGDGCEACNKLGYSGRVGVYEVFVMNPEIEKVILGGKVSEYDMQEIAVKNGMITMAQDGLMKALKGLTTVEEVFRVSE